MPARELIVAALSLLVAADGAARAAEASGPALLAPPSVGASEAGGGAKPPATADLRQAAGDFESLLPPPVDAGAGEGVPPGTLDAEPVAPSTWYEPAYWFGPVPWDAGVELGINGSEGSNTVFSMRTGAHLKRVTERWKYDSSLSYNKNLANGVETQNNGKLDARLDRILAESPWTLFVLENLIYDEFQAFDLQLSLNAGVGYQWLKTPATDLLTRFGAGATREFGGVEDDWQPQALMGVDLTHQLSTTQRLVAKVDYFPEWEDFRNYRVVTDLGWQVDLDRPRNVSLKLSVIDRYDSTPEGAVPNNFDYALLLIWKL